MMAKKVIEVLMVFLVFILLALIVDTLRPAYADHHGYYGNQPGGSYHGGGDPYHYSDVQNPPQFTIYRDDRRGDGRGSDPYHYSDVQDPPQFTIYRDRRW